MRAYIAAGWFSDKQEEARQDLLTACRACNIEVYSPKDHMLYVPGKNKPREAFDENVIQIEAADFVLASTVEKDMGTIFECGYAFAMNIPIVYYCPGLEGPFNLMLAESARAVFTNLMPLIDYLLKKELKPVPYIGEQE